MENDASPPSTTSTTTATSTPPREETVKTTLHLENQNFGTDFASLYHSIFPPKSPLPTTTSTSISLMSSPSTCSSSIDDAVSSTQNRLNQARLILQYQELNDHYDLCRARLIDLLSEAESLRHENAELRLANAELLKLLSSQASFHNLLLSSSYPNRSFLQDLRRLSTEDEEHSDNRTNLFDNRFSLPKSISVRSTGFTKANLPPPPPPPPPPPVANTGPTPSRSSTRSRAPPSQLGSASQQQRVYVAGGKGEEDKEAVELEVYNQGMMKTELCNKWQETGACPYGHHCQFAHGITELRPVIRHPRYKTELCRMVLAGDTCPYGHRCHFRHTLTDQERSFLLAPPPR